MEDNDFLDPEISLSGKCHTCNELILFAQEYCPYCGIKIDHDELVPNVVNNFFNTQAISAANSILSFDAGVYIFLAMSALRYLVGLPVWFNVATSLVWLLPLSLIIRWFRRHGNWDSQDDEYRIKRKQLKSSFWLWFVAHIVNAIVIAITEPMKLT